ncbi:MAG TPA: hypothetical protein DEP23_10485 [Ruminococcaceae bacterium]|nr:hypothetical protein [Oscillospiraceae bacterium]
MKKIIDGALYNTDTAKLLGKWDNGYQRNDFSFCTESLYRTKSGKYFIHGEGHGNSRYGVWHGNSGGWGKEIRPYTPTEAREWAEKNLTADEYSEIFGEPEEASDGRKVLNISVPAALKRRLERMREETGKSISKIIEEMVDEK